MDGNWQVIKGEKGGLLKKMGTPESLRTPALSKNVDLNHVSTMLLHRITDLLVLSQNCHLPI